MASALALVIAARYAHATYVGARIPFLPNRPIEEARRRPRVSVIVPARNEVDTLPTALASLLAQEGVDLEVVVIDDRSTDGTGAWLDSQDDPRLTVVHVHELPEGWLGKVYALDVGTKVASGEWLLCTDADVRFAPTALTRALDHACASELDHLALVPDISAPTFGLRVVISAFGSLFLQGTRAHKVELPGSTAFCGVGAFNLVRARAFANTPGFSWLKAEIADDLGLAALMRQSGSRAQVAFGLDAVSVQWYSNLRALFCGLEKNAFACVAQFSIVRAMAIITVVCLALTAWVAALTPAAPIWAKLAGASAVVALGIHARMFQRKLQQPFVIALFDPLAHLFLALVLCWSTLAALWRGGVTWRGTLYPLAGLRGSQRVRL